MKHGKCLMCYTVLQQTSHHPFRVYLQFKLTAMCMEEGGLSAAPVHELIYSTRLCFSHCFFQKANCLFIDTSFFLSREVLSDNIM